MAQKSLPHKALTITPILPLLLHRQELSGQAVMWPREACHLGRSLEEQQY